MAYDNSKLASLQALKDTAITTEQVGTPGGLATLDANGKLTASQRPDIDAYTKQQTDTSPARSSSRKRLCSPESSSA